MWFDMSSSVYRTSDMLYPSNCLHVRVRAWSSARFDYAMRFFYACIAVFHCSHTRKQWSGWLCCTTQCILFWQLLLDLWTSLWIAALNFVQWIWAIANKNGIQIKDVWGKRNRGKTTQAPVLIIANTREQKTKINEKICSNPIWLVYAEHKIHVDYNLWISMRSKFQKKKQNKSSKLVNCEQFFVVFGYLFWVFLF